MSTLRDRFLAAEFRERLDLVLDPTNSVGMRDWLGDQDIDEYMRLAEVVDAGHLSSGPNPNLIFVPGIMGSLLTSRGLGGVWWIDARSRGHINDLRLGSDGLTDADPRADVAPLAIDMQYEGFFAAVFGTELFRHASFPYDWRKPPWVITDQFRDKVFHVSEGSGREPVHIVAHSMGGLVVRAALMRHPELWSRIGRIVFLGTPHYGSPAIAGYLKNHLWGFDLLSLLGLYLDRQTFRSLWGVISLLPAPSGIYPGTRTGNTVLSAPAGTPAHPCANFDMYDVGAWKLDLDEDSRIRLQAILNGVADFHRDLLEWHLSLDQEARDRMAVIAGVGYKTLFRVAYKKSFGFLWEHMDRVTTREPGNVHREGDGRVPLASADLEQVGETRYVAAEHGRLPTVPAVYGDVFRFLSGREMQLATSPEMALSQHLADEDLDSVTPGLVGSRSGRTVDDPGYLDFDAVSDSTLSVLQDALGSDQLPEFAKLRVF